MSPHTDLDHEDSNPSPPPPPFFPPSFFFHHTPAYDDVSPYQFLLQKAERFQRYRPDKHAAP